jgi:hypothetical protein
VRLRRASEAVGGGTQPGLADCTPRLARDYEGDPAVSEAFTRWAAINMMIRRLDRGRPAKRQTRHPLNPPTNSPLKHSLSEQLRREPAFRRSPLSPHNVRSIWHTFGA